MPPGGAPSGEAVLTWAAARDAALRGLVHALSNRVGTVAAVGGMLGADAPPASVGTAARVLAGEGERLEALLAHLRLVTADPFGADAAPEPLHVPELVAEVAALAAAAGWDVRAAPVASAGTAVPPAMASRAGLAQALLVLAHAAGEGAHAVVLRAGGDGAAVRVWASTFDDGPAPVPPGALAACGWLLGATAVGRADGGAEVRVPPLSGGA